MIKLSLRIWVLIISLILAALMLSPSLSTNIIVKSVDKDSVSYEQGIRQGMIIQQINSYEINSLEDYSNTLEKIFYDNTETRISILTDSGEFIFLANNLSELNVGNSPHSNLKTGLDLSGGTRAIIRPENASITSSELDDLVDITSQRLNAFGLSDISVRATKDFEGNNFMVVEIAGATPTDIKDLLGNQGKFEAKIANTTVFEGGQKDIGSVCRNDASCSGVTSCYQTQEGYSCEFMFVIYLQEEAAEKHADVTSRLSLDESGRYLNESLILLVDGIEMDQLKVSSNLKGQVATQISIQGSGTGQTQEEALNEAKKEMNRLQTILLTGSLPYKLEIVKLDTISPLLGQEFTKSIIFLGLVAFLGVSVSIFIKYRKIKITFAVIITMFSEAFLTLGIAALIRWNLDAAAIAGIIAGIGTGVNDQIVIIDESVKGREGSDSVKTRIKRAFFIILGAFLTVVAAMLPLFWAGAGLLRGFALTTILGVTVGILITRPAFAEIVKILEKN